MRRSGCESPKAFVADRARERLFLRVTANVNFQIARRFALLVAMIARVGNLANDELQVGNEVALLEELLAAMIARELPVAAFLHVRKLLVDRLEFHFAVSAGEGQRGEHLGVFVLEVMIEQRNGFETREFPPVDGTVEGFCVDHQDVELAGRFLLVFLRAVTALPCELVICDLVGLLRISSFDQLSLHDNRPGGHWHRLCDVPVCVVLDKVHGERRFVDVKRVASAATWELIILRDDAEQLVAVHVRVERPLVLQLQVAVVAGVLPGSGFMLNKLGSFDQLLMVLAHVLAYQMVTKARRRVRRVHVAVRAAVEDPRDARVADEGFLTHDDLLSHPRQPTRVARQRRLFLLLGGFHLDGFLAAVAHVDLLDDFLDLINRRNHLDGVNVEESFSDVLVDLQLRLVVGHQFLHTVDVSADRFVVQQRCVDGKQIVDLRQDLHAVSVEDVMFV